MLLVTLSVKGQQCSMQLQCVSSETRKIPPLPTSIDQQEYRVINQLVERGFFLVAVDKHEFENQH